MNSNLKIDKENQEEIIRKIKAFFLDEYEMELGDLASQIVLDFFLNNLGTNIYNQGVEDSYIYINDVKEDLLALKKRK